MCSLVDFGQELGEDAFAQAGRLVEGGDHGGDAIVRVLLVRGEFGREADVRVDLLDPRLGIGVFATVIGLRRSSAPPWPGWSGRTSRTARCSGVQALRATLMHQEHLLSRMSVPTGCGQPVWRVRAHTLLPSTSGGAVLRLLSLISGAV